MPTMSPDANLMKFFLIFKNTRLSLSIYILTDQLSLVIITRISLLILLSKFSDSFWPGNSVLLWTRKIQDYVFIHSQGDKYENVSCLVHR